MDDDDGRRDGASEGALKIDITAAQHSMRPFYSQLPPPPPSLLATFTTVFSPIQIGDLFFASNRVSQIWDSVHKYLGKSIDMISSLSHVMQHGQPNFCLTKPGTTRVILRSHCTTL